MNAPVDPLAGLRDLHLPAPISWWPPAPGWWGLAILGLALGFGACWWWRSARRCRYKKIALQALARLTASQDEARLLVPEIASLLRRVAIESYGRPAVARLTGAAWLEFLDRTGKTSQFSQGPGQVLGTALYQPDLAVDPAQVCEVVKTWIKGHRPC
ncbi:MAG: DUF4381 domain-containing protein [Deltaproteobacteria bacterium CG_4_10_14_3_um_filter_60_8]|nr:MAG: hypothetical protein AUK28_10055 [Desulfobacterales bacterium CG2_30_60_27]PIY24670.1 MAG: DUF4381 domain-containing protein [Deltaproteobacteria bacterium CG_4_10_14_3_um_filter_60_8]